MKGLFEDIQAAVQCIQSRVSASPRLGMILGTGLGGLVSLIQSKTRIPYRDIPGFTVSTVESHAGQLVCGQLAGVPVVAMEGRFHSYEGYSMRQVTFPVRVMKALGVEALIVTNAAGGLNPHLRPADVVIIDDHINLMAENPLRGINDERLGPRFPDMSAPYDDVLIRLVETSVSELGVPARRGVLAAVSGPNLETRAEYRMLRLLGADVVSMSTVPEVIVAAHAGLRTLGFSIVTDMCLPDALEPAKIERIVEVASEGGRHLERLIPRVIGKYFG